ncbi:MAG: cupredoxin domain-containing protein [Herpetosiphonaceae bacterium]|nr:cupredoxin domain-containing protein [Herpetosiphonaceae bacterium]
MSIRRWTLLLLGVLLLGILAACGEAQQNEDVGIFKGIPDAPAAGTSNGGAGGAALVSDSAEGAELKFAQDSLTATTGTINITFNNKGIVPHNWTLVKPENAEKAANEGAAAGPPDYLAPDALAQTKTIAGGQSYTISFSVTEPGTYEYICTFPGHYVSGMRGTLTVTGGGGADTGTGAPAGAAPAAGGDTALTSSSAEGATLAYAETTLEADAGSVTLTFNNKGIVPHNWTLVNQGDEDKAATEAQTAAPDYKYAAAIAQTKMLNGSESDTITFDVGPGTYTYICTFPGHYISGMKGTLVVK